MRLSLILVSGPLFIDVLVFCVSFGLVLWLIVTPESSVYKTLCLWKNSSTECLFKLDI